MIAKNLAHQALLAGHTARFITASELLNDPTPPVSSPWSIASSIGPRSSTSRASPIDSMKQNSALPNAPANGPSVVPTAAASPRPNAPL